MIPWVSLNRAPGEFGLVSKSDTRLGSTGSVESAGRCHGGTRLPVRRRIEWVPPMSAPTGYSLRLLIFLRDFARHPLPELTQCKHRTPQPTPAWLHRVTVSLPTATPNADSTYDRRLASNQHPLQRHRLSSLSCAAKPLRWLSLSSNAWWRRWTNLWMPALEAEKRSKLKVSRLSTARHGLCITTASFNRFGSGELRLRKHLRWLSPAPQSVLCSSSWRTKNTPFNWP